MLDTHARKYVQPMIERIAELCIKCHITANGATIFAFVVGLLSSVSIYLQLPVWGVIILWISGLLDAIDGTIARVTDQKSNKGALMDITFDRLVEVSLIIAFALIYPQSSVYLIFLLAAMVFSMTVFLVVGNLAKNTTKKAFFYQAGVAERTEGFVFFSLMALFPQYFDIITIIFAALIVFTGGQRFIQGLKILD